MYFVSLESFLRKRDRTEIKWDKDKAWTAPLICIQEQKLSIDAPVSPVTNEQRESKFQQHLLASFLIFPSRRRL